MSEELLREKDECKEEEKECKKWSALDPDSCHPFSKRNDGITQKGDQENKTLQLTEEYIFIKDSCDVDVSSVDTKAAVSLQAALQAAIAILISISIADNAKADQITQELLQSSKVKQVNFQKTVVENSRGVTVNTVDTQISINIQLLLQILIALLVRLDIL
ncbi:spore coat protein [Alkalicoccobacillus murimartini]|uniref:Spore coat protein X n=1 Tax=Alkalicoccobacillus murimartini TaxID=171685 RepID=A0ABT9YK17_9BACI|nr:spore coat protein [Alkalicoccobacillus murimartini]MDQ0208187.1 spore coat protein X [Alkalicoccobacillus murimartini]